MLHLGAILLILDPFWDDVGSILESFLTFAKPYLKAPVFCVFLGWRCSSLWRLIWPPEVSNGALQESYGNSNSFHDGSKGGEVYFFGTY